MILNFKYKINDEIQIWINRILESINLIYSWFEDLYNSLENKLKVILN